MFNGALNMPLKLQEIATKLELIYIYSTRYIFFSVVYHTLLNTQLRYALHLLKNYEILIYLITSKKI